MHHILRRTILAAAGIIAAAAGYATAHAQRVADVPPAPGIEIATFAGGCYWCVESDFDKVEGVVATISGFMGGTAKSPTYEQVTRGGTGHLEVVQVHFDPKIVSYERLVYIFWRTIDPLDQDGQFCDKGDSYRTAIFTHTPEQARVAEASKKGFVDAARFKKPIATTIRAASEFTSAPDYHQDFYKKSPGRYYSYRAGCGRDAIVKQIWGAEAGGAKPLTQ